MSQPDFTGVILAGGASRRMGTDKGKLRLGGKTMLAVMREKLLDAGAKNIVVLGRADEDGGIADRHPGCGPVNAALHYLDTQRVGSKHLFVPVDMPALDRGLLRLLGSQNYWAQLGTYNLPFLAIADGIKLSVPKRLYDLLMIKMARRLPVPQASQNDFLNLNRPRDYAEYAAQSADHASMAIEIEVN